MKSISILALFAFPAFIAIPISILLTKPTSENHNLISKKYVKQRDVPSYKNPERACITFILGEDEKDKAPYYSLALDYFKTDKYARTEFINNTCRSLIEVRDYLKNNPPANGLPWGLINLVTHGNEWYGMSVSVAPGSKRSSTDRITEFVNAGKFDALPDNLADDTTEIFLHGCGLGNDHDLLKIVAKAFGGKGKRPIVTASKLKEYYSSVRNADKLLKSQLFYAKTWSVCYKFKNKPDDEVLAQEFKNDYPNDTINWAIALKHNNSNNPKEVFYYTINLPIHYMAKYNSKDSLPDLSSEKKKEKWVSKQKVLADIIAKSKIPVDKFKWTAQKNYIKDENNNKKPVINITGWCTILCIVKPLVIEEKIASCYTKPFFPEKNDSTYFGVE